MTSIDLDGDLLGHEIIRSPSIARAAVPVAGRRPKPLARKIAEVIGLLVMTGTFLAATIAAVPVIAVYSFIWIAKI